VYQISSKSVNEWLTGSISLIFKMAAAAIIEKSSTVPLLRFPDSACFSQSVYQISSKLVDKWPTCSNSLIFKMAAAAILENGGTLPHMRFSDSQCILQSVFKFDQSREMNGLFTQFLCCCDI
jgi:hypothetical protein